MEIERSLVVSTAHISADDNEKLANEAEMNTTPSLVVYTYQYGFLIYTGSPIDELIDENVQIRYSEALSNLLRLAKRENCQYLKIDCDAQIYPDLEVFDW